MLMTENTCHILATDTDIHTLAKPGITKAPKYDKAVLISSADVTHQPHSHTKNAYKPEILCSGVSDLVDGWRRRIYAQL